MATPFVQGRLRKQALSIGIDSECAHCAAHLRIDVSDAMECQVREGPETILVFEPSIDWAVFKAPTIVRDY
jgi:hypothetical protein